MNAPQHALPGPPHLALQLQHPVEQRLRRGRAAGDVDVDRHDTCKVEPISQVRRSNPERYVRSHPRTTEYE
ncbi:hypothetical protein TRAPUB_14230 [Trametes pubescens]|uniref:Uncharacterized protein n=1 Tax=Trametes pubescens TaxID=154538 RepID=A0A1M2VP65_TRAPU|nr:hypothetical protein TRAPUB_14230 [Trametes pubescens]